MDYSVDLGKECIDIMVAGTAFESLARRRFFAIANFSPPVFFFYLIFKFYIK
jgi:hypothetical protein